ncbi:MAG: putative rane protein [Methanothermobacter sp.]|jgi:putative membrane protein|nr:putative rane protein [Methanothermobacter sp.]MDN5374716.1 putative rane protein [Methanothermobacter sp.]
MRKALEIFWKDMKTVKNSPVVLFVIAVIICIPALYAVFNIQATLDPYSRTSSIEVAVVNEDRGADFNGTHLNVGAEFVSELRKNRNFDWQFVDRSDAMDGLRKGKYYAVLIIPGNFSSDLLSIKNGTPRQASIKYMVNDKLNPVAPRITNAGADALQAKINSEVVKTIDGIVFGKISEAVNLQGQTGTIYSGQRDSSMNLMEISVKSMKHSAPPTPTWKRDRICGPHLRPIYPKSGTTPTL